MTSKVRIEWIRTADLTNDKGRGNGSAATALLYGAKDYSAGATPILSDPAPAFGDQTHGFARVTVLTGAADICWGDQPIASATTALRVVAGQSQLVSIVTGQVLSLLDPAPTSVAGTFTGNTSSATYAPEPGREYMIDVWGAFSGTVILKRSINGGATWVTASMDAVGNPATWTGVTNVVGIDYMADVLIRLDLSGYVSGTVNYRLGH